MRISEAEFNLICQKQKNKRPSGSKESEIQKSIKLHLEWHGWFVVKIHQSLGSYKGIADLYAIKDGRQVWIEVKTPKGVLSEHQERFRDDVERHGGVYLVARSVDDVKLLCKKVV
ncbi:VRR-NUC domain-containing protein [Pelosinus sp. sgz500959]|uniref:VRR-NUC domain-containing protein n=1 Tax=Pelosinus sp. sgz500959 TaxID=3242472 RepID=UPI00367278FB